MPRHIARLLSWCGVEQEEEARLIAEEEAKEEAARKAIEDEKAKKRQKAKDKVAASCRVDCFFRFDFFLCILCCLVC